MRRIHAAVLLLCLGTAPVLFSTPAFAANSGGSIIARTDGAITAQTAETTTSDTGAPPVGLIAGGLGAFILIRSRVGSHRRK
jgi:type III secretory pathway component EscT